MEQGNTMKIIKVAPSTSFGIKVPVKTAIEAASGTFLDDAKVSYPRQIGLLGQLSGLDTRKLYTGEVVEGFKGMRRVIKEKHPDIAESSERISKVCRLLNETRTFQAESEELISKVISNFLEYELSHFKNKEIDIDKIALKELGLDKYENL